jgi:S-formylglutathione hydrolase FrmB
VLTLLAAAVMSDAAAAAKSDRASAALSFRDGAGLHVLSERHLDSRLLALTVSTRVLQGTIGNAAVNGPASVRILLPDGYAQHPHRRYPVLYLLHGTSGGAADWTTFGGAEQTTAGLPLIVVMPDIALADTGGGWCTNWVNGGAFGPPEWETFHIDELIPWVDRNLRTIPSRSGRAIAGLSQGGFCSTSYPARHPDMFIASLSYSGAPDIAYDRAAWGPSTAIINATELGFDHVPANSMFGPRSDYEVNWATHDPATLAANLRGIDILLYTGNGQRGPLDPGPPSSFAATIEMLVHEDTLAFHSRLEQLHIPSYLDDYGPGTHSFPYWARDLRDSIGRVMAVFAHPPRMPSRITYTIADPRYSVFGWTVSMHRSAEEFSTLEHPDARGFALAGSGSATVWTPPRYRPGVRYRVRLTGRRVHHLLVVTAGDDGRLRIEVPLGPANPYRQYTAAALRAGTKVFTTSVLIALFAR